MTTFNAIRMTLLAALAAALSAAAVAQPVGDPQPGAPADAPADPEAETVEEVLVAGERAGPGLWKVRKGDHTLFLLATITPAPKKIEWRSREVESVLARAQGNVPTRRHHEQVNCPIKHVKQTFP